MNEHEKTETVVSARRAKQGRRGTHVLTILLASLALAAIVWFLVEMFY